MTAIIEVEGVSKAYGEVKALSGINLSIPKGTVQGLLGPNGAGKTTLVRILATLLVPDTGFARIAGFDTCRDANTVRSIIGLAGQYAAVDEMLSGRENLVMVGRLYRLGKRLAKKRAEETLERLNLTEAAARPVKTYSGGMRRRLDLGASLVGQPKVLILDEPTTGLDPRTRVELWQFIRDLVTEGTTVLLTTQYLEEADQLADQISVIDHGKMIARGSPDQLKARLGGDRLELSVPAADFDNTVRLLQGVGSEGATLDREQNRISIPIHDSVSGLMESVTILNQAGIVPVELALRRPSLDDVFLALTGQPAASVDGDLPAKQANASAGHADETEDRNG